MKKIATITTALIMLLILSCFSLAEGISAEPTLNISVDEVTLAKGKSQQLTYTIENAEHLGKAKVQWSSSEKKIAGVENGRITGIKGGNAEIYCTCVFSDGTTLRKVCSVTVTQAVSSITLPATITVDAGYQTEAIQPTIKPESASCKDVIWSSSDETIAIVDANGIVKGVAPGKTTIIATSAENTEKPKVAKSIVNVLRPVESIQLSGTELTIGKGKSASIGSTILPEDASNKKATWTTSDKKVATVANGKITGVAAGHAVVTCYIVNANGETISADCNVTVIASVNSIAPQSPQITVNAGCSSTPVNLKFTPGDATYKTVVWKSENEKIATVDENGVITGVTLGQTKIIAESTDPTLTTVKKCTINVKVNRGAEQITISGQDVVAKGKTMKLTATVLPNDTTNKKIKWTSLNPQVAAISSAGVVTPKTTGFCTVKAEAEDGSGVEAEFKFQVIQAVTSVKIDTKQIVVFEGKTQKANVTVMPSDATNRKVKWTSSDTWVATVDDTGKITAKHRGKTTLTCTAQDGSKKYGTATVYVEPKVPLTLEGLSTGVYMANLLGLHVKNHCQKMTIVNFDFDMQLTSYYGMKYSGSYSIGKNASIGPGQTKVIKRNSSGVGSAHKITITITGVTFRDGTYYSIPTADRDTWTFTIN